MSIRAIAGGSGAGGVGRKTPATTSAISAWGGAELVGRFGNGNQGCAFQFKLNADFFLQN